MDNPHRLLFLDPGHFHAALTVRTPHPRVADELVVYAPDGAERRDFLALVRRFPHPWRVGVVTTADPLAALIAERRGDVVVVAGRNAGKARAIRRLHEAGFHVLADKPWLVRAKDLDDIRASFDGPPFVAEIMTGRHDLAARALARLVASADVFGDFRAVTPALELDSVHHLAKRVDGVPLRRPWWFFDVGVQGSGVVDIPTHLVDRAQWLAGEDAPSELVGARLWPTRVPLDAFRAITGESQVPPALRAVVDGDALAYACNAELDFRVGGVAVRARCGWEVETPPGGGDASRLIAHGERADVRLEQGPRTNHRRRLLVEPRGAPEACARALRDVVAAWQADWPGVTVVDRADGAYEIAIPAGLDGGHETHFAHVLGDFLETIDRAETLGGMGGHSGPAHLQTNRHSGPARLQPNRRSLTTLAKYALLARAVSATLPA
ncbi:MAG TPA: putative oxidoreductase C-terminal domain-containing protein [Terriglobales bacterium]|nr:putative oxidoreductase C-terminal domain-containing protein [Terriglobales bacterium]